MGPMGRMGPMKESVDEFVPFVPFVPSVRSVPSHFRRNYHLERFRHDPIIKRRFHLPHFTIQSYLKLLLSRLDRDHIRIDFLKILPLPEMPKDRVEQK